MVGVSEVSSLPNPTGTDTYENTVGASALRKHSQMTYHDLFVFTTNLAIFLETRGTNTVQFNCFLFVHHEAPEHSAKFWIKRGVACLCHLAFLQTRGADGGR